MDWLTNWMFWPSRYKSMRYEHWALSLVAPPECEPVTISEAKAHLRVDFDDDDNYISGLIMAARFIAEERTNRAFITQTWDLVLDQFPNSDVITLRKPRLQTVKCFTYKDSFGISYDMPTSDYIVDTASEPGRIILGYGKTWPWVTLQPGAAITIRFDAGYGDASEVPQPIKQAMLFLISQWYEQREPVAKDILNNVPMTFDYLIGPYKVWRFQ